MIIRYYHVDRSGMPTELASADGTVQWRVRPGAWGAVNREEDCDEPCQPLRFQGQYFDAEIGLHYNQHRYYDSAAGRFITQDPIGLQGGIHPYRYVLNPVGYVDPLGLQGVSLNYDLRTTFGANVDVGNGVFGILAHGSPGGRVADGERNLIDPVQMANAIRSSPEYRHGMPIVLFACYAGSNEENSYAQRLANEIREDVYAPSGGITVFDNGTYTLSPGVSWDLHSPAVPR